MKKPEPLRVFVTGGAGTGKTFVLKTIAEQIRRCYSFATTNSVFIGAITGVASRLIQGRTLHSLLKLAVERNAVSKHRPLTGVHLQLMRSEWRDVKFLIIDEISMVSYEVFESIHLRLTELFCNDLPFGGLNVIVFGDLMQLKPVQGHWVFENVEEKNKNNYLWSLFEFCELSENMRQSGDTRLRDLLNNLRFGKMTSEDISLLLTRLQENIGDEHIYALRIFPTNKGVNNHNAKVIEIMKKNGSEIVKIKAQDEFLDPSKIGKKNLDVILPLDPNKTGSLVHELELCEGARIMLRYNLHVSGGLVNGSMGKITFIKWRALRREQTDVGEMPECVMVRFDDPTIGINQKDKDGCIPIKPKTVKFKAPFNNGEVERTQLPLILCWAVTVHKLQGTTVENAIIDLGRSLFTDGHAYVALSRVKSLDGIILSDFCAAKLNNFSANAFNEMKRLRNKPRYDAIYLNYEHSEGIDVNTPIPVALSFHEIVEQLFEDDERLHDIELDFDILMNNRPIKVEPNVENIKDFNSDEDIEMVDLSTPEEHVDILINKRRIKIEPNAKNINYYNSDEDIEMVDLTTQSYQLIDSELLNYERQIQVLDYKRQIELVETHDYIVSQNSSDVEMLDTYNVSQWECNPNFE